MRTIGEVSDALGVKAHVLRYWEQQFPMLSPLKRSGGRRLYRSDDVALLERISTLVNDQGYTLKGVRQVLESKGAPDAARAASATSGAASDPASDAASNDEIVASLKSIRSRLADAVSS